MRSFSPWQLPAFPLYLVEQAVALRVGTDILHKDAAPDLVRAFQVFPEQHRPAADKHHAAGLQVEPPLPERPQDVVHESPCHVPHDAQDLTVIVRPLSPDDPVDVRVVQQDVLLGIDAGGHVIVELDDALLKGTSGSLRVANPQVRPAAPDQQVIQREAPDVKGNIRCLCDDLIELRYPLVDGHGCRIILRN